VFLTQVALVMSLPLLIVGGKSRRDLVLLLGNAANYFKFGVLFLIGMAGLLLFKLGLSNAHPIIISAIINLQPFFAALVALLIAKVPIPVSPAIFFGCLVSAFLGAMAIAWSQVGEANQPDLSKLAESAMHGTWLYAIPVPICSALGGTLICKWFAKYDESAAMAANFAVSALVLIPTAGCILYWRSELHFGQIVPVILMIAGTIIAASVGRVLYQIALSVTGNDNGFVTMFFLLIPALTALISIPLSWWIADLHFAVSWMFYVGSGCRLDFAPVFFAEILGTAGSEMITTGCRYGYSGGRLKKVEADTGGLFSLTLRQRKSSCALRLHRWRRSSAIGHAGRLSHLGEAKQIRNDRLAAAVLTDPPTRIPRFRGPSLRAVAGTRKGV
jgi:drug/metabolite transporter (DMT)-like permease